MNPCCRWCGKERDPLQESTFAYMDFGAHSVDEEYQSCPPIKVDLFALSAGLQTRLAFGWHSDEDVDSGHVYADMLVDVSFSDPRQDQSQYQFCSTACMRSWLMGARIETRDNWKVGLLQGVIVSVGVVMCGLSLIFTLLTVVVVPLNGV